jgi:hypothetical protein
MLGMWQSYSGTYLIVACVATLTAFGIPLVVVPLKWARTLRWEIPASGQLAAFLGRSLGVFLCVFAVYGIKAAITPAIQPFVFELLLWLLVGMLGLHIYGALRREQPITETIEIALWVVLILATVAFFPAT